MFGDFTCFLVCILNAPQWSGILKIALSFARQTEYSEAVDNL